MSAKQEEDVLLKSIELIKDLTGKAPTGYVAPWWEFSNITNELLLKHGFKYDHSLMHNDFTPYFVRVGDSWSKIDYSLEAKDWMKPLIRGVETDLVEIPANWYLDDLPLSVNENARERKRARLKRVGLLNRILVFYGLKMDDWQGTKFVLRDKKGQSVIVNDLGDLWDKAQKLAKKEMDALDSHLLAFLNQNTNAIH
ncbi:hypothetical protein Hpoki52_02530 [Helicobacter pylori]